MPAPCSAPLPVVSAAASIADSLLPLSPPHHRVLRSAHPASPAVPANLPAGTRPKVLTAGVEGKLCLRKSQPQPALWELWTEGPRSCGKTVFGFFHSSGSFHNAFRRRRSVTLARSAQKKSPGSPPWGTGSAPFNFSLRSQSMATDPNPSLTPKASPDSSVPAEVEQALSSGLADCSLRELLGLLLSSVGQAERQAFLERTRHDRANGF